MNSNAVVQADDGVADSDAPLVAVLILNWNTPDMTLECLESVLRSTYPNFHLFLLDNGSSDASYERLTEVCPSEVSLYRVEKNIGYVGGMNYLLNVASKMNPDYFLIMNNDTVIAPDAISALVETAREHGNQCLVTGKVYFYNDRSRLQTVGNTLDRATLEGERIGYRELDRGQYDEQAEREMIDDIFMLVPQPVYHSIGGYSPYFFLNYEQKDFVLRAQSEGYKAVYTPRAKLWHKGSFSSGGLGNPYMMFWDGKSSVVIAYLHLDRAQFWKRLLMRFRIGLYGLLKSTVGLFIGHGKLLKPRLAYVVGLLSGVAWLVHRREERGKTWFKPA